MLCRHEAGREDMGKRCRLVAVKQHASEVRMEGMYTRFKVRVVIVRAIVIA